MFIAVMARRSILVSAFAIGITACSGGSSNDPPVDASFAHVQSILNTSCGKFDSCHSSIGKQGDLVLDPASAYAQIVNRASSEVPGLKRVVPGNPSASYLMNKLDGSWKTLPECSAAGGAVCGVAMPQGGTLDDASLRAIREWIAAGAKQQ